MSDKPGNHLLGQSSPYLAAHAHDPVDWRPWGEEAFALARKNRKPILLSIGYQSCHWCHVMQRESFKDADTASYINKHFVAVKVDRELRPDVDHLYMSYVTLASGAGGWPMTVVLTPELLPFFGGTYFPKLAPRGMPSFMEVLESVSLAWKSRPDDIAEASEDALDALESVMRIHQGEIPPAEMALEAANKLLGMADHANGGIGTAPKFPQLPIVDYLLAHHELTGDKDTLTMAEQWIYAMIRGGIYDQAGGGLFRYATDQEWLVPHFEKMLYDSAMLLSSIARLYRLAPAFELAFVAQQTVDFMIRDLGRPGTEGRECDGFYSSLDAESLGVEGGTYLWTLEELEDALEPEDIGITERQLGVSASGNWHGHNILTRRAGRVRRSEAVDRILRRLLEVRMEREQPALITNTHVEWNALAVKGLFDIGAALEDEDLLDIANGILDWLLAEAVDGDHVAHAIGDPSVEGLEVLADYAALIAALIAAVDVGGRADLLPVADRLLDAALERFGSDDGRLFESLVTTELPVRPINADDAPTRSGASTLAQAYHRLRPDDPVGFKLLIEPLGWIMNEAPHLAGGALEAALLLGEQAGEQQKV